MTETIAFSTKSAYDVPPGQIILRTGEAGGAEVCIKAERMGKEFVRHYLVPLSPIPEGGASLVYLDPEDEVATCEGVLRLTLGPAREVPIDLGVAFVNGRGTYLKVDEHRRFHGHKALGYLDLASGDVRSRQEKAVKSIHPAWRLEAVDIDGRTVPIEALREAFAASTAAS